MAFRLRNVTCSTIPACAQNKYLTASFAVKLARICRDYQFLSLFILRANLSGAVYCYRSCLQRRVCGFVGLLP